jgi:HAD superfamily hydrolase (TIGR01509 family)
LPHERGPLEALIFDCDGVLVDTERDGHRIAFNDAFRAAGLDTAWDVARYGDLLTTGGGKERMIRHFEETGWPVPEGERGDLIARLHRLKTDRFMALIEAGTLPLRPGVARLVDEALGRAIPVAVCSTSNERAVAAVVRVLLGEARAARIAIFAGDVVPRKKPDPAIYRLAAETLGLDPARTVVVEDSHIGLAAAKGAGMNCIVTVSTYTDGEDFSLADRVVADLDEGVDLALCDAIVERRTATA